MRIADLPQRKATLFELVPDAAELTVIARDIGADAVRKLRFAGSLTPDGTGDWVLAARLGATLVQPCVVSLAPVTTRIEEAVARTYLASMPLVAEAEAEVEDDTLEPLGPVIDLGAVLTEALALALPLYPRAPGVEFGAASYTEDGPAALEDRIRPFAGLRDQLATRPPVKPEDEDS